MNIVLLIIGILLLAVSLVFTARQSLPSAVVAWTALVVLHFSVYICLPVSTFVFWGAAALIATAIGFLSPKGEHEKSLQGNLYIT